MVTEDRETGLRYEVISKGCVLDGDRDSLVTVCNIRLSQAGVDAYHDAEAVCSLENFPRGKDYGKYCTSKIAAKNAFNRAMLRIAEGSAAIPDAQWSVEYTGSRIFTVICEVPV